MTCEEEGGTGVASDGSRRTAFGTPGQTLGDLHTSGVGCNKTKQRTGPHYVGKRGREERCMIIWEQ